MIVKVQTKLHPRCNNVRSCYSQ